MNTSRFQLIIEDLIEDASTKNDDIMLELIKELIEEVVTTYNTPSDWKNIGKKLGCKYKDSWVYDKLELGDYENDI